MDNEVRPTTDGALGWAFRPDAETTAALARGVTKIRRHPGLGGAERPHFSGNMEKALAAEAKAADALKPKVKRRRKVAKLLSKKKTKKAAAPASKKKTVAAEAKPNGKMIPLKAICSDLGLDPKATRVRLRRMIAKGDIDWHDSNARWEFNPTRAKEIRSLLT